MTILQDLRPVTRGRMAQLSLPDIRAYAKAYKVPADVIEHGTFDELLDFTFKLRPRHPNEYPINTPHLFTHKVACTQEVQEEGMLADKPYTGFAYRRNLASFRRTKSWTGRPSSPERDNQVEGATEEQGPMVGGVENENRGDRPAIPEDLRVTNQPMASSEMTQVTPTKILDQDNSPVPAGTIPSNEGQAPYRSEKSASPDIPALGEGRANHNKSSSPEMTQEKWIKQTRIYTRGDRPPPVPPPLGFEVALDLSNLKSALEECEESRPKSSRMIVDDELFDLEFTPDMTQDGKETIIRERYAVALSNHEMIGQMLAEAEAEAKQAFWKLTALQPLLYSAHESMQGYINEFRTSAGHRGSKLMRQAMDTCESFAKGAWEIDWNEEWTGEDEKEESRMRQIAQARVAGVRAPSSPSTSIPHSPGRKRIRDEYEDSDELESVDEDDPGVEPFLKRPRPEGREMSTGPWSPSPKRKSRTLTVEDIYRLPSPSSSFHISPPPMPRFGPKDRCNIYPVYNPAVPGCEPPNLSEGDDGKQSGEQDGRHLSPSDIDDDPNDGPEPDPGQAAARAEAMMKSREPEGPTRTHSQNSHSGGTPGKPSATLALSGRILSCHKCRLS